MSAVENAVEEVVEAVEHVEPGSLNLNGTTKEQQRLILLGTFLVGAAVGGGAAYFFLKNKFELKYKELAEHEIAQAKEYYARVYKKEESPEEMVEKLAPEVAEPLEDDAKHAMASYSGEEEKVAYHKVEKAETAQTQVQNLFKDRPEPMDPADKEFDYDVEMRIRSENPGKPYIISHDEFYENEADFEQVTLTYFDEDDVLSDEKDGVVPEEDKVVGEDNITQFGYGSKDPNIVYIRNDNMECLFEVHRAHGSYAKDVLGFDPEEDELKHSERRRGRRRGFGDDE